MKLALLLLLTFSSLFLVSCSQDSDEELVEVGKVKMEHSSKQSKELLEYLPLLPHVEKGLWEQLLEAEYAESNSTLSDEARKAALDRISKISKQLRARYPFVETEERISLGKIVYNKKSRQIEIPATVSYPKVGDKRHPEELELILCSNTGRIHETLFVSDAQPLHLEMLLHIAGFKKSIPAKRFRASISLPNNPPIAIEHLMQVSEGDEMPATATMGVQRQ